MNMSVSYIYADWASLIDDYEKKAKAARQKADDYAAIRKDNRRSITLESIAAARGEAFALESVVRALKNTWFEAIEDIPIK